ncbi:hypothetical protein MTR67_022381 [Solanum verrucosum]|uniref:Uncharacterized protein n=1 Tax=Solanum verrucosum TaxID=315347 RepID=A0AAF0QTB3_SOLVR|nr:hypothetical protein MTR67_022381 [Solanum verrucosum]
MAACSSKGGCPSDYVALSAALLSMILLLLKATLPYMIHKIPRSKGSSFWLVAIQVIASLNLLLSIVMALNFLKFRKRHWWRSCYLWAVWIEGPLGFGLLLSCRITQIFQLYYIFVKRRLPPIRSYIFLLLILLPWVALAAGSRWWRLGVNDKEKIKKHFWEDLDKVVRGIPHSEMLFIGRDFNGHIWSITSGFDSVDGGFGFGLRNGGVSLLDFAKVYELVITNSCFPIKEDHLVTFGSAVARTQIDYLLHRKGDRCK